MPGAPLDSLSILADSVINKVIFEFVSNFARRVDFPWRLWLKIEEVRSTSYAFKLIHLLCLEIKDKLRVLARDSFSCRETLVGNHVVVRPLELATVTWVLPALLRLVYRWSI
jgi:hypothetical protein